MEWIKKGLIFNTEKNFSWMQTHAAVPFIDKLDKDNFRIYFSPRDQNNQASIGFIEINMKNPKEILSISNEPILTVGKLGSFDENGVMGTSLINFNNKKYLYYVGWNIGKSIPFRWSIGLAISEDDGKTFQKFSNGPILDRNYIDQYMVSSPTVIFDGGKFKMYYLSILQCELQDGKFKAPYNIRYAESQDGINWNREGKVAVNFQHPNEYAIARPSIIKENNLYRMWYSYAIEKYKIGYAESKDGVIWKRMDDQVGIDVSSSGWDSISIEYPNVFEYDDKKYMLYCGNDFGKTGFGYAVLNETI